MRPTEIWMPDPQRPDIRESTHYNERRSIMKPRNILEAKGKITLGAVALALWTLPALAAEPDGHAFVRDSIRNAWTPTAVAAQTEGNTDQHERARVTILGASKSPSAERVSSTADTMRIGAHEQARRLLLAQPVVATERARSGS
jgi:hypothetical protein